MASRLVRTVAGTAQSVMFVWMFHLFRSLASLAERQLWPYDA